MASKVLTRSELIELLNGVFGGDVDDAEDSLAQIDAWIARGDKAAVYRNVALDHSELGRVQIVSFGSTSAQLETVEPPDRMPDIGTSINWPYRLEATYEGEER